MNKKINVITYTIIMGIIIYMLDSIFYYIEFKDKYTFFEALLTRVPFWELLNRLLIITLIIIVGMLLNEKVRQSLSENQSSHSKTLKAPRGQLSFNFLSSLSFQIRTPLNAIIGFSELLKIPDLPAESRDIYINHVNSGSRYLLLLINNLAEISKIESRELKINKSVCDITELLEDVFPVFQSRKTELGKPEISLVIEAIRLNDTYNILTDPERLKQVFQNLLENALTNTEKGIIKLGYTPKIEGYVEFFIKDNGRGFSQERLEMIFESHNHLLDNPDMPFDASVLRYAISKSLVLLLGGNIYADSKAGDGTTIFFTIPYAKHVPKKKELKNLISTVETGSINWSDRVILIAEDADSNFIYLEELLKPTKVKIIWAKNGLEALENIKTNPKIELVLMDILMPQMDGYQASKEIKKLRRDLPIIAQTACALEGDEKSEQNINFDSYLTKPIWSPQLLTTISKYIY